MANLRLGKKKKKKEGWNEDELPKEKLVGKMEERIPRDRVFPGIHSRLR